MSSYGSKASFAAFDHALGREAARHIEAAGAVCALIPPMTISDGSDLALGLLAELNSFDWLAFSDVFAAENFVGLMRRTGADLASLDSFSVLACGESVSDVLRFSGIHADVIPRSDDPDVVISAMDSYLSGDWTGQRLLLAAGEPPESRVCFARFAEYHSEIRRVLVYRAEFPEGLGFTSKKTLISSGDVDVFVFASAGDATAFRILTGGDSSGVAIASFNDQGFQSAADAGLDVRPLPAYTRIAGT